MLQDGYSFGSGSHVHQNMGHWEQRTLCSAENWLHKYMWWIHQTIRFYSITFCRQSAAFALYSATAVFSNVLLFPG